MTRRTEIYAVIPYRLKEADDALFRYGRWARDKPRLNPYAGTTRLPYRGERFDDEADRTPKEQLMHVDEALCCQRALAQVPEKERVILAILYVPRRIPPQVQLRIMRIPARLSQERHIVGLNMFENLRVRIYSRSPGAAPETYASRRASASEQEKRTFEAVSV